MINLKKEISPADIFKFLAVILALYLVFSKIDTFIKMKAIDDCAKISRYESSEKSAKYSYPVLDIYEKCLNDKGIRR